MKEGGGVVDGRSRLLDGLVMATVRVLASFALCIDVATFFAFARNDD